jgi:hypothetical protein
MSNTAPALRPEPGRPAAAFAPMLPFGSRSQ